MINHIKPPSDPPETRTDKNSRPSRRAFLRYGGAAALGTSLAGCAPGSAPNTAPAPNHEVVTAHLDGRIGAEASQIARQIAKAAYTAGVWKPGKGQYNWPIPAPTGFSQELDGEYRLVVDGDIDGHGRASDVTRVTVAALDRANDGRTTFFETSYYQDPQTNHWTIIREWPTGPSVQGAIPPVSIEGLSTVSTVRSESEANQYAELTRDRTERVLDGALKHVTITDALID